MANIGGLRHFGHRPPSESDDRPSGVPRLSPRTRSIYIGLIVLAIAALVAWGFVYILGARFG